MEHLLKGFIALSLLFSLTACPTTTFTGATTASTTGKDSEAVTRNFVRENIHALAVDISKGEGETLTTFLDYIDISDDSGKTEAQLKEQTKYFVAFLKKNYDRLFPKGEPDAETFLSELYALMSADGGLKEYAVEP